MATATAMYHSGKNPLKRVGRDSEAVDIVRGDKRRRLHKAFLRYHDPNNWPLLREALKAMGHAPIVAAPDSTDFGSAQLVARLDEQQTSTGPFAYAAGSDHRRDGEAVGY
jgi:gamma-glutamyltranspeptidase